MGLDEYAVARITATVPCRASAHEVELALANWGYVNFFVADANIPASLLKLGGISPCAGSCSPFVDAIRSALTQLFLIVATCVPRSARPRLLSSSLAPLAEVKPSKLELCHGDQPLPSAGGRANSSVSQAIEVGTWPEVEEALVPLLQKLAGETTAIASAVLGIPPGEPGYERIEKALNGKDPRHWAAAALLAPLHCSPSVATTLVGTFVEEADACGQAFALWAMSGAPRPEFRLILYRAIRADLAALSCRTGRTVPSEEIGENLENVVCSSPSTHPDC